MQGNHTGDRAENRAPFEGDIPDPADFREWLKGSIDLLGIAPTALSVNVGLSKNALTRFLEGVTSDIRLGNAAMIVQHIRQLAADREVLLPGLSGANCEISANV